MKHVGTAIGMICVGTLLIVSAFAMGCRSNISELGAVHANIRIDMKKIGALPPGAVEALLRNGMVNMTVTQNIYNSDLASTTAQTKAVPFDLLRGTQAAVGPGAKIDGETNSGPVPAPLVPAATDSAAATVAEPAPVYKLETEAPYIPSVPTILDAIDAGTINLGNTP